MTGVANEMPMRSRRRGGIGVAALVVVIAVVAAYFPGLHGFWGRDDFFQLAFVRLIGSPWPLFVHDHFPVPGSVFRPLGFASMWLGEWLFGNDYTRHAASDLVLHAGVALALLGLLRRAAVPIVPATLCTLLFALHPAVLGTSLWWSARFDLLATLFVLLALQAGLAYRQGARISSLCAALVATLAAMLSKEIGLVAMAALTMIWLRWARIEPSRRARALLGVASILACAAVYLGWRWAVLGTATSGLTGSLPIGSAVAKGMLDWLRQAPGYLTFWIRLDALQRGTTVVAAAGAIAGMAIAVTRRGPIDGASRVHGLAASGLCLLLLPAILQSPVAALNAMPLRVEFSAIEAAMQSRLYYLGIAGVAIVLAAAVSRVWDGAGRSLRAAIALSLGLLVVTDAWVSRQAAQAFAQRSFAIAADARAAVAAVETMDLAQSPCHVAILGLQPPPEWSVYVSMDSVVKALSPDLERVGRCWIHSDHETYFYLMRAPLAVASAAPFSALEVNGEPLPWRRIGGVAIAYLAPVEPDAAARYPGIIRLQHRDGGFDVPAPRLRESPR